MKPRALAAAALVLVAACSREQPRSSAGTGGPPPSILLVTLDTTRADAIGPEAKGILTPAFNGLAARGRRFRQAYATAPETLPSHSSVMTGLYPAGHGVHENGRTLAAARVVAAERLKESGYQTAAFVSSYVLGRPFGLAQGFDVYDDGRDPDAVERSAQATTDRALAWLDQPSDKPRFLWVHYFEPHTPYAPPESLRARYGDNPYLGEVAAMDEQLARLLEGFDRHATAAGRAAAYVIAADHGEGLGEHGEATHGNLLYQSTMHVPLVIAGPGVAPGVVDAPVSTRRVFHTLLDFGLLNSELSLRTLEPSNARTLEPVLGEAMKPYLEYGWQPQIMAVDGRQKAIFAGRTEVFDVIGDPGETRDLASGGTTPARLRTALDDYPVPSIQSAAAPQNLSAEAQRNLASLGYVSATARPIVRRDAPRPVDMASIFETIERASTLFVRGQYAQAVPVLEQILARDPHNLDAVLRLATAHSSLGRNDRAVAAFRRAAAIAPDSPDVRLYLALHYARTPAWERALGMLEQLVTDMPDRLAAWETLGPLAMRAGRTATAIAAFERTRALSGTAFRHDLELGVLYLSARRMQDARQALDRVPASHPEYPMALFKRAQVSVLLNEPDRAARIALARQRADATTRPLIANERFFRSQ
ncbi:MAG: sulfatase-like hydrolase/transferase [Acidobacteriota bacterium]|nr:sulfatase-like hydrolase/transferase [Acidobacteriota bacterium]